MIENRCVYIHKLKGKVVYVGSGSFDRVKSRSCRSKEHLYVWDDLEFEIVVGNITKDIALKIEQALLNAYLLTGNLFNKIVNISDTKIIKYNDISDRLVLSKDSPSWLRWKKNNKIA